LVIAFGVSIGIALVSVVVSGVASPTTWPIVAACLTVITSVVYSWTAIRSQELVEDQRLPKVVVYLDATTLSGVTTLRVRNFGGGAANNILIEWDSQLFDQHERKLLLGSSEQPIPMLLPGESCHAFVDSTSLAIKRADLLTSGRVRYSDDSTRTYCDTFRLSLAKHEAGLYYGTDEAETMNKLRQLPKALDDVRSEIKGVREEFEKLNAGFMTASTQCAMPAIQPRTRRSSQELTRKQSNAIRHGVGGRNPTPGA